MTISLPVDLADRAEREARRRGLSVSGLVRQALIAHLPAKGGKRRKLRIVALGRSGRRNTARDFDGLLSREWSRTDRLPDG